MIRVLTAVSFMLVCGLWIVQAEQAPPAPEDASLDAAAISKPWTGDLDGMIKRRMIRVLVPYSKTHYFIDRGIQRGITHDALKQFETDLNTKLKTGNLRVHVVFLPTSRDRLQAALLEGGGDIVAANVTQTTEREKLADFVAPTFDNVKEVVVTGPSITVHDTAAVRTGGVVAMAIRPNSPQLKAELDAFIKKSGKGSAFGNITLRRYLQNAKYAKGATSPAEIAKFNTIVEFFQKYSDKYDVDWLLMAAQGYQESGLDQTVKSQVGAVGVMQVMPATGKDMNVGDISLLEPNIHAGVKYIRFVIDQYFKDAPMDRLNKGLFAFASYNAGPGRVRQLRAEAQKTGLDPNVWFNNVERVAARRIGRETVQYVSNIYKYYVAYQLAYAENQARREKTETK